MADETRTVDYVYDNLNRLTDENADAASPSTGGYDVSYTYDLVGNRKQRVVTANGQTLTTLYDYDPDTDLSSANIHLTAKVSDWEVLGKSDLLFTN